MIINNTYIEIDKQNTNMYGLTYYPQMTNFDNNADICFFTKHCSVEVSKNSYDLVCSMSPKYMTHGILEIGVSRNGPGSFTNAMLTNKPDSIPYLGVDTNDKSYLDDSLKNIHTIQTSSEEQSIVRQKLVDINIKEISLLFIDGWHSVNTVLNDWLYCDLLSDNGAVFLHDTNFHPGPVVLLDAIDTNIFQINKYFIDQDDYGLTIVTKI